VLAPVGALRRGGQAQAKRREEGARGQRVRGARQVVALVEDDQAEARAEVLGVEVQRVVRRHRERLHLVLAAAHDPDRAAEGRREEVVPLAYEVERGRDDEGAAPSCRRWRGGRRGSCRPCRQDHHAAAALRAPRSRRLRLVRARLPVHARARRELGVPAGLVGVRRLARHELPDDVRVRDRRSAVAPGTVVPLARHGEGTSRRPLAQLQRARHEGEGDHRTCRVALLPRGGEGPGGPKVVLLRRRDRLHRRHLRVEQLHVAPKILRHPRGAVDDLLPVPSHRLGPPAHLVEMPDLPLDRRAPPARSP
jgi:hypothetical protein